MTFGRRSGKDLYVMVSSISLISKNKQNILIPIYDAEKLKILKEKFIQVMKYSNCRQAFIFYKDCIRHKKTGGKIFFKITKPMNPKFEFKGSKTWTI